jgi:flagellar hook-associated protein 2
MSTSGISSTSSGLLSSQLINESGGLTSGSTLTNSGAGGTLQLTGLASGINTTELIQAELAEQEMPLDNMEEEVSALNTESSSLSAIQSSLQTVSDDALLLGEPSTYFPVQNINSSDPSLVTAATTDGVGAVIGSTAFTVTALASAAQTTFDYNGGSSSAAEALTLNVGSTPETINIAAGATAQQVADSINGSSTLGVYAAYQTTSGGQEQLVLSSRNTGTGNVVSIASDPNSLLTQAGTAQDGTDAVVNVLNTVGGSTTTTTYNSPTDTATNVIPGVALTLTGITGTSATDNPVTVTTAAPSVDTSAIVQQVQQFVSDYNTALNTIESDINTTPSTESTPSDYSPYSGSLFGDDQLENLVGDLRTSVYQSYSGTGIATGMTSLQEIGISGGAPTATASTSTVDGQLTVDTSALTSAIESNPNGVEALITQWSQGFQNIANAAASPTGAIAARITGNNATVTTLSSQLTSQEALYNQEETNMEAQWAQVETTLEDLDNQKSDLSSFSDGLTSSTSSSSS